MNMVLKNTFIVMKLTRIVRGFKSYFKNISNFQDFQDFFKIINKPFKLGLKSHKNIQNF